MPPRSKSLKTVCVDSVLIFALLALVGHLTINFWERYTIQSELYTMKSSLHTLKDTITNIGKAYDSLHSELKDLFQVVDNNKQAKLLMPPHCAPLKDPESIRSKNKYTIDHRTLHDTQVQAVLVKRNDKVKVGVGTITESEIIDSLNRKNKSTTPIAKSVATNTKNPLKSVGINSDMSNYESEKYYQNDSGCKHEYHDHLKCYKDFEHCRHICNHTRQDYREI